MKIYKRQFNFEHELERLLLIDLYAISAYMVFQMFYFTINGIFA